MTENWELERKDMRVDDDIQVDDNNHHQIQVYLEAWFDVDKKFGLETSKNDDEWVNLYAIYNPFNEKLAIKYFLESSKDVKEYDYTPSENEEKAVKELIAEKIKQEYNQTPKEFCMEFMLTDVKNFYPRIYGCTDREYVIEHLSKIELKTVENILKGYGEKIDLDIPRDDNEEIDFSGDWNIKILDKSYISKGYELVVLKWYEGFEDTGYMVDCVKGTRQTQENEITMGEMK